MYIILNFVWNLIRARLASRLLVIDEAWIMMKFKDSAQFLFGLVKRARKYGLGITTITQDVEDFMTNQHGKAIVTNSSIPMMPTSSASSTIGDLGLTRNGLGGSRFAWTVQQH
jgi:hypothetical protein